MDIPEKFGMTGLIFLVPTFIAAAVWMALVIDNALKSSIKRARLIALGLAIITGALFIASTWTQS